MNSSVVMTVDLTAVGTDRSVGEWVTVPEWAELVNVYAGQGGSNWDGAVLTLEHAGQRMDRANAFSPAKTFNADGCLLAIDVRAIRRLRLRTTTAGAAGDTELRAEMAFWGQR